MSVKQNFSTFKLQNLKQQAMSKTRPQPSATNSLRMSVLVVMAVRKNPVTRSISFENIYWEGSFKKYPEHNVIHGDQGCWKPSQSKSRITLSGL
jgi:hypothetical protein